MLEHVYGFPPPPPPFPFHLNSNEMQNENKWKDSALKMDLSQQPAATSRLNSDPPPPPTCAGLMKEYTFLHRTQRRVGGLRWNLQKKKKNVVRKEKGMMEARENEKVMLKNIHLWRLLMKKDRKACHRYAKINWDTIYINWRRGWQKKNVTFLVFL